MRFSFLFIFLLAKPISSFCQKVTTGSPAQSIPIFRDKMDSISFAELDKIIKATKLQRPAKEDKKMDEKLDSALRKYNELLKSSIGQRYVYMPRFILLDSLTTKEERKYATQVTIYKLKSGKLPIELFECENIERLELVNTSIDTIQSEVEKLKELKTIEIYNNKPGKQLRFGENNTITRLIIRGENEKLIPIDYSNLKALEILDLCRNNLTRFPVIKKNKKLTDLLLVDNSLKKLKVNGRKLPPIKKVDLRYNQIKKLGGSIGKLSSLRTLFLNFNAISKVGMRVGRLKNLEYLSLYENQLVEIPTSFYQLTSLINIDLYYNHIEHIKPGIAKWKKLSVLHIANNRIYDLPANIGDLQSLRELYSYNNRLTTLPKSLDRLTQLKVLRVNDNYLDSFPYQALSMPNLQQLDISNNRITSLPKEIFKFEHFQILGLQGNQWNEPSKEFIETESQRLRKQGAVVLLDE
jgi:Leucine-rich repeat (LRR) protein